MRIGYSIFFSAVQFEFGMDSRPTGRATVAFPSHKTAQEAMQYDKCLIGMYFPSYYHTLTLYF